VTLTVAFTMQPGSSLVRRDVERDFRERQRVAQRYQLGRALRRHDAGDPRGAQHVAFFGIAGNDQFERRLLMTTRPSAMAVRSVAGLAETSTMRASPLASIWVRLLPAWEDFCAMF